MSQLYRASLALLATIALGLVAIWWRGAAAPAVDDNLHDSYYVVANIRNLATLAGPAILNLLLLLLLPIVKDHRAGWIVWGGALVQVLAVFALGWMVTEINQLPRRYDDAGAQFAAIRSNTVMIYGVMLVALLIQLAGWLWLIIGRLRR